MRRYGCKEVHLIIGESDLLLPLAWVFNAGVGGADAGEQLRTAWPGNAEHYATQTVLRGRPQEEEQPRRRSCL